MIKTKLFFTNDSVKKESAWGTKKPCLLSLDFDGTLSEIAPTPDAAFISEKFRSLLRKLSHLPETQLALLSGRALADLKHKVRLPRIIYVGNHGIHFSPSSLGWDTLTLKKWTFLALRIQKLMAPLVQRWPKAYLESKGPDLSLHYRNLNPRQAHQLIDQTLKIAKHFPVNCHFGKCVLELRPREAPNKGDALRHLADLIFKKNMEGVCIYIGDDRTDEDAFRVLRLMNRKTLGLKVGKGPTRAPYRLKNVGEVYRFLCLFLDIRRKSGRE